MRRNILLLLTLSFVLSSCGLSSQYVGQRFSDGIYSRPAPEPEPVKIYTLEELKARAQYNIEAKKKDTLVIVLDDTYLRTRPFYWEFGLYPFAAGSIWVFHHFWDPWFWDDPFFWHDMWFWHDPWYRPWHDPWYRPWGPWGPYGPYGPWGPGPIVIGGGTWHRPGFNYSGGVYRGSRISTQSYSDRVYHPSSGSSSRMNYRPGTSSYSTRSAGAGTRNYSAGSSVPESRSGSGYNYIRSYDRSGSATNSGAARSSSSNTYNRGANNSYQSSRSSSSYSSGASRSSMGSGSFGGGGGGRSMGGGSMGGGASRGGGGGRR